MAIGTKLVYQAVGRGRDVALAVAYIKKAQELLDQAKETMDAITTGGTDTSTLGTSGHFGVAPVDAAAFYTAVNNMRTNVKAITTVSIANLLIDTV